MRSQQIHRALAQGHSRFDICQMVSKGVRITHKPGARFEDSIGGVLEHLSEQKARPRAVPPPPPYPEDIRITPAA